MKSVPHRLMYLHNPLPASGTAEGGNGTFNTESLAEGNMSLGWPLRMSSSALLLALLSASYMWMEM